MYLLRYDKLKLCGSRSEITLALFSFLTRLLTKVVGRVTLTSFAGQLVCQRLKPHSIIVDASKSVISYCMQYLHFGQAS